MDITKNKKKVAVIGAGPTGLVSAKCTLDEEYDVDVFEQNSSVGGLWVFTDKTGFDEDGFPIHSAAYEDLRTNVPKEIMEFSDFRYPKDLIYSYISATDVVKFFEQYADKFSLLNHIKFNTRVIEVKPMDNSRWYIKTKNLKTNQISVSSYDAVMICNGHYSFGYTPDIPGNEKFKGIQIHSHDYRSSKPFFGKKTLIIGYGLSGQDLANAVRKVTDTVFISYRFTKKTYMAADLFTEKPLVTKINEHSVEFNDGTVEEVDAIIYCTGYEYHYPFLSDKCGITVEEKRWVRPLYKGVINIEYSTMAFIGLQAKAAVIPLAELQARFFLSTMNGHFPLPQKNVLWKDFDQEVKKKREKGFDVRQMHYLNSAEIQGEYFEDLASTANIPRISNVINKIYEQILKERTMTDVHSGLYKIIDDENFVKIYVNPIRPN